MLISKLSPSNKKDVKGVIELQKELMEYHSKIDEIYRSDNKAVESFRRWFKRSIKNEKTMVVVAKTDDGKIVGYFMGIVYKPRPEINAKRAGFITNAYVKSEHRGTGLGKKMFEELLVWFKKKKAEFIELNVDSRNVTGMHVWEGMGFKEYMRRMRLKIK